MIFVNHQKSAKAAKDYYTQHIAPGDGKYYTEENAQQMKGVWHGRGAEMLQLSGEVKQEDFFKLCDNINPATGERLTARTDDDRRVMTDLTFDVPKSVTLAYELGGDERILNAFRQSLRETMGEIEANVQTRVRKNGADNDRPTGNMVWAEHIHRTARPVTKDNVQTVDPQLHAHATVFNATYDSVEKRWKAIQLGDIVRDKGYYQAAFHARMAHRLKDLGYGIERDGNSFRIAGIDRSTVDKFSQRTTVIEREAERLGIKDAASKSKLGRRTRERKGSQDVSMEELRKEWDARLSPEERLAIKTARNGFARGDHDITPEQAKEYALEHSFQNASAVSEKRLKAEALSYAVGSVKPEDVADIAQHPEAMPVPHDGQSFVTTKTVLNNEVAFLQFALDGQRKQKPLSANVDGETLAGLSAEQRKAALHILTSRDTVTGVVGKAGSGKTTAMRSIRDAIESVPGRHVFAFAPSSQASRGVLAKEGFKDAETLAMLLKNEKLQEKTKGQILWIDEAGQVSSKDMRKLMDIAKRNGNRVILSGDYTQHASVEAGDAFRLLEKEAGVKLAKLTEIRRQKDPKYRKAVEQISKGTGRDAQKGFDALDKMGSIIEASGPERHSLLVADYLNAVEDGKSALIIAPTHIEGERLTDELRRALKERGAIGKEREFITRKSTGWTDAQKSDIRNYEPGMVVEFNQNAKGFARAEKCAVAEDDNGLFLQKTDGSRAPLPITQAQRFDVFRTREIGIAKGDRIRITKNGEAKVKGQAKGTRVNNGDVFTVEGFTKEGDIRLGDGKLLPKSWGHMALGYVDTSYASQGKTVDRVFVAIGKLSLPAANIKQWYVSLSRGKEMAKVYVEDKQEVREAISRGAERLSAVELTHTKLRPSWRQRLHQSWERNRVNQFLKTRAAAIGDYWRGREALRYA
jgi:conjugative relaxase-like TrwC/TraI family protein